MASITVSTLRKALEGLPDDMPVHVVFDGGYGNAPATSFNVGQPPRRSYGSSTPDKFLIESD